MYFFIQVTQCEILPKAGVISREGGGGEKKKRTVTEPEIIEDFISITEGQKKRKKLKREEEVEVKLEKEEEVTLNTFGFSEGRKKDKKTKKQNIGGGELMTEVKEEEISEKEEDRIYPSQDLFADSPYKKKKKIKKQSEDDDNSSVKSRNISLSQDLFAESP